MSNSAGKMADERISLFKDTIKGNPTNRIPHLCNVWTWKIQDAGYKLSDALFDYNIMLDVHKKSFEKYRFDAYMDLGQRNPLKVYRALGFDEYNINDEQNALNVKDQCILQPDEYKDFLDNPNAYLWSVGLPRKFKKMATDDGAEGFRDFLNEYKSFGEYLSNVNKLANEYGIPTISDSSCYIRGTTFGFEIMFNFLRGIKGCSVDMRRNKEYFDEAVKLMDEMYFYPALNNYPKDKIGSAEHAVFDGMQAILGHTILSAKQFEKYYWPDMKLLADFAVRHDKLFYIFCEGNAEPFFDFFKQLPAGHFAVHCEQTDIIKMRKEVPNVTVVGGIPTTLLGNGTKEQCVDHVKRMIQELAYDGGLIFSEDKMISFRNECTSENLNAVCDYISEYRF